ncbi:Uncharacterised protein [Yersinia mollaretii]|uniref:hypothetical protein n=1 Tax=Yersinia mollaretii TaxID=33060 RepID=UPI0005E6EFC1|nr:hypothetical protein [Yersinia mollaretii]CNK99793.1 Uncharacterised protein [Yersinia mollaretii]
MALLLVSSTSWAAAEPAVGDNCELMVSQTQIDYGQNSRGQMLQRGQGAAQLPFGKREVVVNAVCQQPVPMKLVLRGNGDTGRAFRFGPQGQLGVQARNVRLDGNPAVVQLEGGRPQEGLTLKPGDSLQVVSAAGQPLIGKSLTLRLELEARIAAGATRVNEELRLEENLSLELITQ